MNRCGFKSVINPKKSKFNPIAKGINPNTAVNAVNNTGLKRDFPDSIITSFISSNDKSSWLSSFLSATFLSNNNTKKSINTIPFFTTIPANEMIPIMVIRITKSIPAITYP